MANKTKYTTNVSQTSGGHYATFSNLNNIKKSSNYAQSHVKSKKKTANRPSTITCKTFKLGLPTGALATKVTVYLKHSKVAVSGNKVCNIPAPTIGLYNGSTKLTSKKGKAPTTTPTETPITFSKKINYDVINNNNFTVKIDYPTNTNENEGYVRVYYVKIKVTYRTANYSLSASINDAYQGETTFVEIASINNNLVKSAPTVSIVLDYGLSFKEGTQGITIIDGRRATWKPRQSMDVDTLIVEVDVNVTFPTSTDTLERTVNVSENLSGHSKTATCTIHKNKPTDPEEISTPDTKQEEINIPLDTQTASYNHILHLYQGKDIDYDNPNMHITYNLADHPTFDNDTPVYIMGDTSKVMFYDNSEWKTLIELTYGDLVNNTTGEIDLLLAPALNASGLETVLIFAVYDGGEEYNFAEQYVEVVAKESDLSTPSVSVLTLTPEELARLGDGYSYTVQSYLKENTNESYVREWYKNFRIAVFNNPINTGTITISTDPDAPEVIEYDATDYNNLTISDIIQHAEYWSNQVSKINEYDNIECEFQYNKDCPLYILIVGDYSEATTPASISFTEPCIIESEYYNGRDTNGIYPAPINNLITNDGSSAEANITSQNTSNTLVFYDWPLTDNFGTNTEIAVRGLAVKGTFQQNTDDLVLNAALVNDKKESRQRSIVLDELNPTSLNEDNEFHMGQLGDLWGYTTLDIVNLEDWEVHLNLSNVLNDFTATANFGDIQLIAYIETIEQQNVKCFIEGEDISYYGAFITNVKIPEGLETDTDYITVDGTDINDPYRQNIRTKTIEVEFEIGDNCDLEGATLSLRELTKLLINKRDKYNRPIPKRIEFTHYPDVYWEYIMEDALDSKVEISSYTAKAKLTIPAGTSYDKETTSTSTTGYISGLAAIRPVIQVSPTEDVFNITEKISSQEFNMGYSGDWTGKIVEIDCDNRIVWLKENEEDTEPVNISKYVDYNADFFVLYEEYQFTSTGCIIRSVDYEERW